MTRKHQQTPRDCGGIDYQSVLAQAQQRWLFAQFAGQTAQHLGRKGGMAAFTGEELERLHKAWQRLRRLDGP